MTGVFEQYCPRDIHVRTTDTVSTRKVPDRGRDGDVMDERKRPENPYRVPGQVPGRGAPRPGRPLTPPPGGQVPPGMQGHPGHPGQPGYQSYPGYPAAPGVPGPQAPQGYQAPQGTPGPQGYPGQPGVPAYPTPPPYGTVPRQVRQPGQASFQDQLAGIAKDATLNVARAAADRVSATARNRAPAHPPAVRPARPPVPVRPSNNSFSTVVLAVLTAIWAFGIIGGISSLSDSVLYGLGQMLSCLALLVPCAWPLVCRRRDRKAYEAWEKEQATNRELVSHLTEEDAGIAAALSPTPPPEPVPRHWKRVCIAAGIPLLLGIGLTSAGDDAYLEKNPGAHISPADNDSGRDSSNPYFPDDD